MNTWYDKLDRESGESIRCFVSSSNENPLDNEKLVIANIYSRIVHQDGDTTYTEINSGNHYRHAMPCEDALSVFLDEYVEEIGDITLTTYREFFSFIHRKPIDGMFFVQDMEDRYNELLEKKKEFMLFCDVMDGYQELMMEEHEKDMTVFNEDVLPFLSEDQIEQLKICMEDSSNGSFKITDEPCTSSKEDDYDLIDVYVDQWRNGGHTGDDFAGTISVALLNGKYFTFDYQC